MYILRYDDDLVKRVYKYEREEARKNAMLVNSGGSSGSSKADASNGGGANPFVLDDETAKTLNASSAESGVDLEESITDAELAAAENGGTVTPSISEVVTSFMQIQRVNNKMNPITAITDAVNNELRSLVSAPAKAAADS